MFRWRNFIYIFDAHADTLTKLIENDAGLYSNDFHLDISRMIGMGHAQVFAVYLEENLNKRLGSLSPIDYFIYFAKRYRRELLKNFEFVSHADNYNDMIAILNSGKIASIFAVEGGEFLQGDVDNLYFLFQNGVRILTLTWKFDNEIAGSINTGNNYGLTEFGKEVVKTMNKIGMLVDVSHLSEKAFWQVLELSNSPIIASHSNARAVTNHFRNLTDEQILAIKEVGGFIGMNFNREFLTDSEVCSSCDLLNHTDHMISLGAELNIGFGSDFDGVDFLPQDIQDVSAVPLLKNTMSRIGYSDLQIERIFFDNFFRLFRHIGDNFYI